MSYETQKKLVIAALALYVAACVYVVDRYPFFNWALFTNIPNEQNDYAIEIHSFDGVTYSPPLPSTETRFIFSAIGKSPTDYAITISELGAALTNKNTDTIEAKRTYLERIFNGKDYSYSVVHIVYDPVERWRTGEYKLKEVVGTFDSDHAE